MSKSRVVLAFLAFGLGPASGLMACGEGADVASDVTPQIAKNEAPPRTLEVLSPGAYRLDDQHLSLEALNAAFAGLGNGSQAPTTTPVVIVVPASLELRDTMPAIAAALQPPGHVNLTLRIVERGRGREATVPVLSGCTCRAVQFHDGGEEPLPHDSRLSYVFVTARIADDGATRIYQSTYDALEGEPHPFGSFLPDHLPRGAPTDGEPLDLGALRTWFDALANMDVHPLLCLDYRDSLAVGHLVDTLIASKNVLGPRVLLGPSPREPEVDETPVHDGE